MDNNKRPEDMERITTAELAEAFIEEQVKEIREQVGDKKVLLALSGGVDSSVVAAFPSQPWPERYVSPIPSISALSRIHSRKLFSPRRSFALSLPIRLLFPPARTSRE